MHTDAPHISFRAALALGCAVILGCAALVNLLIPSPGSARPHANPAAVAPSAPQSAPEHAIHAGGTAVSSTMDSGADAAFFADLFDGAAVDLTPTEVADLTGIAHRMCDLGQPRAAWLASLTSGPHALTDGEATKLYDTAHAAYCPQTPWQS